MKKINVTIFSATFSKITVEQHKNIKGITIKLNVEG